MTEREQIPQSEQDNGTKQLEQQLLTTYYGEVSFRKVIDYTKREGKTAGLDILIPHFAILSEMQRTELLESLNFHKSSIKENYEQQAAFALKKNIPNNIVEKGKTNNDNTSIYELTGNPGQKIRGYEKIARHMMEKGDSPKQFIKMVKKILEAHPTLSTSSTDLLMAEYQHFKGGDSEKYFKKALEKINTEEVAYVRIDSASELIQAQHRTTGIKASSLSLLANSFDNSSKYLEDLGNDADKLDRMEIFISAEDATLTLASLGLVYETVTFHQKTLDLYRNFSPEESLDYIDIEVAAKLVVNCAKAINKTDKLTHIPHASLVSLTETANKPVLKALGYLELVDIETFKTLPVDKQIMIAMGSRQKDGYPQRSKTTNTLTIETKNIIQEILNSNEPQNIEELRTLLIEEVENGGDYKIIARITKGLIEIGDEQGKEIAAQLFSESKLPEEIRIYIAKKLCDSGYWDPQIVQHFRNYSNNEKNQTALASVQIETLETIINQMHTTPSLAIYKVLEGTRLNKNKKQLNTLVDFGNFIFMLPDMDVAEKINLFSYHAELFNKGEIREENLDTIKKGLANITNAHL